MHAVAVKGTFDDCQALVKGMFNDHAFRDRLSLSGVNSINWARIAGQLTYYFVAAVALGAPHRPVSFAVPTGNFGDIFAAYAAKRMGLPIEQLVIASNVNDILPRALESGSYEMRDVVATSSPSMDIQISSNFERYLFEASGRDAALIRDKMERLAQSRRFELGPLKDNVRSVTSPRRRRAKTTSPMRSAACSSECGYLRRSAHRLRHRRRRPSARTAAVPLRKSSCRPRTRPSSPTPSQAITGERPPLPERFASLLTARERITVDRQRSRGRERPRRGIDARGQ